MKLAKKKGYEGTTIRGMIDDGKVIGIVGTINDLHDANLIESKGTQYSFDTWMCIPTFAQCNTYKEMEHFTQGFGATREQSIKKAGF